MEEIKNKRITKENIIHIAKLMYSRYELLSSLFKQYEEESKDYNSKDNSVVKDIIVASKPHISFEITMERQNETKDDINWFVETLLKHSDQIERVTLSFTSYYYCNTSNNNFHQAQRSEESIYLSFRCDYISLSSDISNPRPEFNNMLGEIKNMIYNAPPRYDETMTKKTTKENLPSLSIGLFVGLIFTVGLYLFCRFLNIDIIINPYVCSEYFAPVMLALSFVVGLIIPGKNHALYRKIEMRRKYVGYDKSTHTDIYENDVRDFTDQCEVEIGKFSNYGKIRAQIEENYKKSKKIVLIETLIFIGICILLFLI